MRVFNKKGLIEMGFPYYGWLLSIFTGPPQIAKKFGISTWYDLGSQFFKRGFLVVKEVSLFNSIWLFIAYPLVLGLGYIIGDKIYNLLK